MNNIVSHASKSEMSHSHFRFDTIDITRAALSEIYNFGIIDVVSSCIEFGHLPDACGLFGSDCRLKMIDLLKDFETLLRCDDNFMMGYIEKQAMNNGNGTAQDSNVFLFNARNLLTMWGPSSQINDYAARHYSGLMEYYR